ncbi:MAG: hypothetical protein WAX77_00410 [Methylococcaceae bacterium]
MNNKVKQLQDWFDKLQDGDKKEVMEFLYGKDIKKLSVLLDGINSGPLPSFYALGPQTKFCPKCGNIIS